MKEFLIKTAEFDKSSQNIDQCPKTKLPEFALIGRSNVGKSSLINMLTKRKKLAKISSVPGKTQLINHFNINNSWYLVDLPGYGWSKVSKKQKASWGPMIEDYLLKRENLYIVMVLIDSRHEPQQIDVDFINWLGENEIPLALVFTKADKQSRNKTEQNLARYRKALKENWEELPMHFTTSSVVGTGRDKLLQYLDDLAAGKLS